MCDAVGIWRLIPDNIQIIIVCYTDGILSARQYLGFLYNLRPLIMQDIHILEFHDDILGRYRLATEVLPILRRYGYKKIGLEGFIFGQNIEQFRRSLLDDIEETKEMLHTIGMDSMSALCAFGVAEFTPAPDLFETIYQNLHSSFPHGTAENIDMLLAYIHSSLVNRSILHLVEQLEKLDYECIPIENPSSASSLQTSIANVPIEKLNNELIDSFNSVREEFYNQRFIDMKQANQEPLILLTGCFHYNAIQSPMARVLLTSNKDKVPNDMNKKEIQILDFSTTTFQKDFRKILNTCLFSIRHYYSDHSSNTMTYFQDKTSSIDNKHANIWYNLGITYEKTRK